MVNVRDRQRGCLFRSPDFVGSGRLDTRMRRGHPSKIVCRCVRTKGGLRTVTGEADPCIPVATMPVDKKAVSRHGDFCGCRELNSRTISESGVW